MHKYVMDTLGKYVEETYCCPEKFTMNDLCELKCWGKAMKELLEADKLYNIIEAMENGNHEDVEMTWDEFIFRFKDMYGSADTTTKQTMKAEISKIIG